MQQILHTYKLRLTNLSQGNRSLKLARLSKRRDIDLTDLGFLESQSPEDLIRKVMGRKEIKLLQKLDARLEATNLIDRRLNSIYRELNTIFEETGSYDLFVGYPFIEGKFIDDTIIRCPLVLFPVRLNRNLHEKPRWSLSPLPDQPIKLNKTFFLAYEQFQLQRLSTEFWEMELEPTTDWLAFLTALHESIKEHEIEINLNPRLFEQKLERFPDYLADTLKAFKTGQLKCQSQAVLGIFPQSDSALLQDYESIENDGSSFDLEALFPSTPSYSQEVTAEELPEVKEEDRFFVTAVDATQEEALLKVKAGNSLVIHGPPGTGKSQVIVNMIADAMAHGKKVLLVSQKRAALDVVYHRLQELGLERFAYLLHDYRMDRAAIYQKIRQQIDDLDQFKRDINNLNLAQWQHAYNLISRQADQLGRKFDQLYEALTSIQACGKSVHQLYLETPWSENYLPLRELSGRFDSKKLQATEHTLYQLLEYKDLLAEDYPWQKRLSFHHLTYEDQHRIREKLLLIPEQLSVLHRAHSEIPADLSVDLLYPSENQKKTLQLRKLESYLQEPATREDVGNIGDGSKSYEELIDHHQQFSELVKQHKGFQLLKDKHWKYFHELETHVEVLSAPARPGQYFSLAYWKARWFVSKMLQEDGISYQVEVRQLLVKEFSSWKYLQKLFSSVQQQAFLADFPLLESTSAKENWLTRKDHSMEAYRLLSKLEVYPSLHPVFSFGELDIKAWKDSMEAITCIEKFSLLLEECIQAWNHFLHPSQQHKLLESIPQPDKTSAFQQILVKTFDEDFQDLKALDILQSQLSSSEEELVQQLLPEIAASNDTEIVTHVIHSIQYYWISQYERENPILMEVSARAWYREAESYGKKLADKREKVTELIDRRLKEGVLDILEYNRLKNPITYRNIYHQVSKKRRIWSVRKLIRESWEEGLNKLAPCWLASPESVSAIFPMQKDFFDLVIFDEASQCYVERALPALLRGKQCVVAGDEQQLQPLNLYAVKFEDAETEFVDNEIALEVESILDLAKSLFPRTYLRWHYRSQDSALIQFSNKHFYEDRLQVIPPPKPEPLNLPPIEWKSVPGSWSRNTNLVEAQEVIQLIRELLDRPDKPSIGVVTFNYHQQELIKDLLDAELEKLGSEGHSHYHRLTEMLVPKGEDEAPDLFIKNIENVQGDERDIIIFSIAYAPDMKGKLQIRFGLLNQEGGANRLNVAITRARLKIYVLCSFQPSEMQVEGSTHKGPKLFKGWLQFAKAISDQLEAEHTPLEHLPQLTAKAENAIADELSSFLKEKGYHVIRNLGDTAYRLDIAVKRHVNDEAYLLGIICEGPQYFSGISSKEREVYRDTLLKQKGWNIHRVWARNYWMRKEKEQEKLITLIEGIPS
ncbi:MAG: AAA domain-containing protein [Bacteroidota bacterium]